MEQPMEDAADRELFETIKATYSLALEPEQHAMVRQLQNGMRTVPQQERMSLIDGIRNAIGQNLEDELEL